MDKEKVFAALKQAYASLGLSDTIMLLHAGMLADTNAVSDTNLDDVVAKQATYLKGLQSANDKRVNDAIESARKKFSDEEEERRKAAEESAAEEARKAAALKAEQDRIENLQGFEKMFESYKLEQKQAAEKQQAEFKKMLDELTNKNRASEDEMLKVKQQLAEKEKSEQLAARKSMIQTKARELGISDARINEGFAIADDLDDAGITNYLNVVAANQKAAGLPTGISQRGVLPETAPTKEDVDAIAAKMLG